MTCGPSIVKDGLVFFIDAADPNCFDGISGCKDLSSQGNNCTAFGNLKINSKFGSPGWNFTGYTGDYIKTNSTIAFGRSFSYEIMLTTPGYSNGGNGYVSFCTSTNRHRINLHMGFDNSPIFLGYDYGQWSKFSMSQMASGYGFMYIQTTMENGTGKVWFSPKESGFSRANTFNSGFVATGYFDGPWTGIGAVTRNESIEIGRLYDSTLPVSGSINFVRIYNRALSEGEVLQNYNAVKGRFNLQ